MADNLSALQRSNAMRQVKGKDTTPEIIVRALVRKLGHPGYRLHRADIQGKPDIAWLGLKRAIFVNGCFWHGHSCKRGARQPITNGAYWLAKIGRNHRRDVRNIAALRTAGWKLLVVWECEIANTARLRAKLGRFLIRV